jgi:hypothetical protein
MIPPPHTRFWWCPLLMQVLLACGQWGIENDSMIEWMSFYEEHIAKFRQGPHIPWKLNGSSFSFSSVT